MRWVFVFFVMTLCACERDRPPAPTTAQAGELDEAENLLNQMDDVKGAAPAGTAPSINHNMNQAQR